MHLMIDSLSLLRSFEIGRSLFAGAACFALAPAYGLSSLRDFLGIQSIINSKFNSLSEVLKKSRSDERS